MYSYELSQVISKKKTKNNTDLNTLIIKTSNVGFTVEKSNEREKDLPNNTDKKSKIEKQKVIRKKNDLIKHSKNIKPNHLHRGKLHLDQTKSSTSR